MPAFNEASVIGDVVADLRSVFDHVVVVDDGSKDDTRRHRTARRRARGARTRSISVRARPSRPASSTPAAQPGARVFATFDADGQHRVKDVVAMIDRLVDRRRRHRDRHPVRRADRRRRCRC